MRVRGARAIRIGGFIRLLMFAGSCVLAASAPASAQLGTLKERVAVHVNAAFQPSPDELRPAFSFRAYGEDARFQALHGFKASVLVDAGGHIRVWWQLSIGVSYTELSDSDSTVVTGTVPHPLLFNSDRAIQPRTLSLEHRERAAHIQAAWVLQIPNNERLRITVSGGPSFFNVTQGVVTGIRVSEAGGPPFSAVNVDQVSTADVTRNAWGAHIGADVAYMLTDYVGVGGFVRFSRATVDVSSSGSDLSLDVGGVQTGGGIRFRF